MKTSDQSAQIDLLRKKLRIMEIEVEAYRDMGGLAVKGASRSALLNRLLEFALKAVDAASGALYWVDENGCLTPYALKGQEGLKDKALASLAVKSGKPRMRNGTGRQPSRDGGAGSALAVPLVKEKRVSGVITAS